MLVEDPVFKRGYWIFRCVRTILDEFVKSRIYHVVGVWFLVFNLKYMPKYQVVTPPYEAKHKILNTLVRN